MTMTPVQLPEVPEPSFGFDPNQRESEDAFRWRPTASHPERLYTAAQLREYATTAVLAERERVAALAGYYRELEKLSESTPSETNSER